MNTKPFLALGAAVMIAIGLRIISGQSASAQDQKAHQDQKPPQDCSDGWAVRQDAMDAMREQMAAMKVDAARLAAAAKEEYAQNAAPAIAKMQAQLAEAFARARCRFSAPARDH